MHIRKYKYTATIEEIKWSATKHKLNQIKKEENSHAQNKKNGRLKSYWFSIAVVTSYHKMWLKTKEIYSLRIILDTGGPKSR